MNAILFGVMIILGCLIPTFLVVFDHFSSLKTARVQIKDKTVFVPVLGIGNRFVGLLLEEVLNIIFRKATKVEEGIRFMLKPKGWLWAKLRVNREIYHAIDIGDWVDVEYHPWTHTVNKLTVYKSNQYIAQSADQQVNSEIVSSHKRGFKYALVFIAILLIGGFLVRYSKQNTQAPYQKQWEETTSKSRCCKL